MAQIININDNNYPRLLKKIGKDSPKKLYCKGNLDESIFKNCLAVVGSRHLTSYGRRITEQFVSQIAMAGITIVSGFMYGGDEAAHSSALRAGGRTIAVMPCGIDLIHPEYQEKLYNEILKNNGLIISEYEGKFQPVNWTYARRNRIVAGLSKAILIVEAGLKSGTLITAGYAKKYNRKIFAVPGPITSEVSKGTIKLIKEGATPITDAEEILKFYNCKISLENQDLNRQGNLLDINKDERDIIEQLKREPMEPDMLARALNMPVAKIGTMLSLMQLKGYINNEDGRYYID